MRKLAFIAAIVIALIVIGLGIFLATFNPNDYRGLIQSRLEQQLGRKVTLGDMSLGLLPLRFRVMNISVADDPRFANPKPFLRASELAVSIKLLPLLSKNVEMDSLALQRPNAELIKNAQGVWNFASLGANKPAGGAGSGEFSLGKLTIDDGLVAITDQEARKPRIAYDHINITLKDFSPSSPFSLEASAHLPGPGAEEIRLQGDGGPLTKDPNLFPFKGSLDLKGVSIAGLQKFLQTSALTGADGMLSGHTTVDNEAGKVAAIGQISVDKPRVKGSDVGYPIALDYDLNDDLPASLLKINKATLKLGQTPLYISGTVNTKPTTPQLNLNVRANDVSIAEAAKLLASAGVAFGSSTTVNGKLNANLQATGAADKPALNGTITGRDLQISGKDIAQPVSVKTVKLALTPAEVRSDPFYITSGGTTATSQFSLRQYTTDNPSIDATLRAPQAALPELLSIAKAYGVTGLEKISGAGTLALDLHAAGAMRSLSSDEVMRTMNGTVNVNLNNVRYSGVDIGHQISSLGGFMRSGQADKGYTNIQKMTGNILIKNGMAETSNLQGLLDIGTVGAVGTANLVSQALNMSVTAVLNKAFSQQVGGGSLTGALANPQGEIVVPAIVTGTLQNPRFSPDLQKLAQMRFKGLMPTADNPLGGAAGILGGLAGQQPGTQKGQTPQQQNPVNQIIDLFGKKKK